MTEGECIFDGDLLRARLWLPDRPTSALYVTFRQWDPEPGQFDTRGPVQRALSAGLAHLHVQSRWNDWFLNAETPALEAALRTLRARFLTARALGFSMGGYAALRFSKSLRLNQVLIVSPQVSLHLPGEDRYPQAARFDPVAGDLSAHARPDLTGVMAFDPTHRLDRLHAERIMALLPGIQPARLSFGGHPGTAAIGKAGGFPALQRLSLSSRLAASDVVLLHRSLRRTSAHYWSERADRLLRCGRTALAAQAMDRTEALADPAQW
ncbi:alpha/beta hydrolase [Rhodobacter sp. SY28-1]|uniref:alpha/beta hydrolase n=1 Tax=Rhodobacter sp. SY28-1 TaxID=2562317 RepID=UPI0010C09408|nr:alpha/beta hydrolase [Rhodobacter sp. SY28-1]